MFRTTSLALALALAGAAPSDPPVHADFFGPPPSGSPGDSLVDRLAGIYVSDQDPNGTVSLTAFGWGRMDVRGGRWSAVGWFDRGEFVGVWREPDRGYDRDVERRFGLLRWRLVSDSAIAATFAAESGTAAPRHETWRLLRRYASLRGALAPGLDSLAAGDSLPRLGEYVRVDRLPEVVERVAPRYPEDARRGGVEGSVMVAVLVGADGLVHRTQVLKSIPGLDAAAVAAVSKWRFRPAMSGGRPIATWVTLPVRFTLQ